MLEILKLFSIKEINSSLTRRNNLNLIDNGRESNFTDQVWIVYNYDN